MRILFLGDLVGRVGRTAVIEQLPELVESNQLDFVIVNGENAASGFGITETILQDVLDAGADVVTTGNHVWDQRDTLVYIERQDRLLRPVNYPSGTPGRGAHLFTARNGARVMVANVMGRAPSCWQRRPSRRLAKPRWSCFGTWFGAIVKPLREVAR